jgi:intracellular sulfur oxidation DsrE/DsrF family protein
MNKLSTSRRALMGGSLAAAAALAGAATVTKSGAYRVVFQVSDADPKKWNLTLNNVKNVQEDLGAENIAIEIVVYGPGIDMLKADSEVGNRVNDALQAKVAVVACENTMRARHFSHDDMLPKIGYVAAGVVELIKRQSEGYAYIRA